MVSSFVEGMRIYNLFPLLAGTIDEWQKHFERIAAMNFTHVFINPFHETGNSGSLYAVKDYYRLNAKFRGKSRKSSDNLIKQFVKAAQDRGLTVMMDLVINHTATDSPLTQEKPHWYVHENDGSIAHPYAVDPGDTKHTKTIWYDLAEIDFSDRPERQEIIDYFTEVVAYYVKLGVRAYRCDAAYKVPNAVWRQLFDTIHQTDKDVVFVAESLGALLEQVEQLRGAGFDYLMNSSKWWDFKQDWLFEQYDKFRSVAPSISFPETHDTERLADDLAKEGVSDPKLVARAYRQAYVFAAAFSTGLMIPIGFEYGFRKKLHVVETTPGDWEEPAFDLSEFIGGVNKMKASHRVLNEEGPQRHIRLGNDVACLVRRTEDHQDWAVTLINIDRKNSTTVRLEQLDGDISGGSEVTPGKEGNPLPGGEGVTLEPGEVRVFVRQ
jgi:starch synthase (maltosyl-transferring)